VTHDQNTFEQPLVLVTGATGYIGGRLVPRLVAAGYRVRCLVRSARKVEARPWATDRSVQVLERDFEDGDRLINAMRGCTAAYYLVHSMMAVGSDYRARDQQLATDFARAAEAAGVGRIVYLGGLGEIGDGLSEHLTSRREVEAALASTSVPVTVLRAAIIIGAGSASIRSGLFFLPGLRLPQPRHSRRTRTGGSLGRRIWLFLIARAPT